VLHSVNADDPEDHLRLLEVLAIGLGNLATNNAILRNGGAVVVLNPEHAAVLANAGLSRADIAAALRDLAAHPRADIERYGSAFMNWSKDEDTFHCFASPEQILVLMAGGSGLYSMVMPSWCAGAHRNSAISVKVEMDQACEIPG
jgi:hypothetical protein